MHPAEPADRNSSICLNMIVKNETKVLDRLFRSVKDYIDYWVIVDGSFKINHRNTGTGAQFGQVVINGESRFLLWTVSEHFP